MAHHLIAGNHDVERRVLVIADLLLAPELAYRVILVNRQGFLCLRIDRGLTRECE